MMVVLGLDAGTEPRKAFANSRPGRRFAVGGEQRTNGVALCRPDAQYPQPMMVPEVEARELLRQLVPQAPHTEITFVDVDIVEQHDRAVRQLGAPSLEIMPDGIVGMESVDMQQVDRAIGEICDRRIESAPHEVRKSRIADVVIVSQRGINLLAVKAGLIVAKPSVDSARLRAQAEPVDCLAERQV